MTTRSELRSRVRRRLEDESAAPLWSDALLDEVLDDAFAAYGIRFPAEASAEVVAAGGEMELLFDLPIEGRQVVRAVDPRGSIVPRMRWSLQEHPWTGGQAWRWWNGRLMLQQPATAGTWRLDFLQHRVLPAADADPVALRPGDEEIVVLLAAAGALLRRAVEQGKRGHERDGLALSRVAEQHTREAERLIASRRRRAWGGWLSD